MAQAAVKRLIQGAGLEPAARRVLSVANASHRRDAKDDENLDLLLAFTLAAGSNCVDIGANRGDVLAKMVALAPEGRHFAFEPIPDYVGRIRERCPGATVQNLALSNAAGTAQFSRVVGAEGYSGLSDRDLAGKHTIEHFEVALARLDDVLPPGYAPSFVKIDVEGAELQVLQGATATLRAHRPRLWFEHGHISSGYFGATPYDVWDLLCGELGYRIFNADGEGPLGRQAFFDGPGRPMWSYVAH